MSPPAAPGTLAEFADADALAAAVRAARASGWRGLEAHAPHPVPDAAEALGVRAAPVAWIAAGAGVAAAAAGWGLAWAASVQLYPLNVGGRPPHAWAAFLPAVYIVGVLAAAVAALLAMLWLNGLPRLHHPLFAVPAFLRATEDRFFLFIPHAEAESAAARALLAAQGPLALHPVPPP
ncbi:quinol:electron acceptor oxidoreductase subunit ActD [Roseococcus sp. DSY-14]|uniref:quinol:electron acceptor oxidoreductase subunit ActD n=1 Tax=Roseococcus sp. DSY-14 TaxID=3369650 RepID=UPI00387B55B5